MKKLDDREKLESTYERLVELIKRDLERDPAAEELPENEKVRQKIIEGQQKRGKTSKEIFHESAGWRHLGQFSYFSSSYWLPTQSDWLKSVSINLKTNYRNLDERTKTTF